MTSILFVCHGNICRSPMAEFVMKDLVSRAGLADQFVIESAATSTEELGNPVHPGTVNQLSRHGIGGYQAKRARQIRPQDFENFDFIIGMDEANLRNLRRAAPDTYSGTIQKLLTFTGSERDVADPWYTGDFETTYDDIQTGCTALLEQLQTY